MCICTIVMRIIVMHSHNDGGRFKRFQRFESRASNGPYRGTLNGKAPIEAGSVGGGYHPINSLKMSRFEAVHSRYMKTCTFTFLQRFRKHFFGRHLHTGSNYLPLKIICPPYINSAPAVFTKLLSYSYKSWADKVKPLKTRIQFHVSSFCVRKV